MGTFKKKFSPPNVKNEDKNIRKGAILTSIVEGMKAMEKLDKTITKAVIILFIVLSFLGGRIMLSNMYLIAFVYVVFEGVRLKNSLVVGSLGALIGAAIVLPQLFFYPNMAYVMQTAFRTVLVLAGLGAGIAFIAGVIERRKQPSLSTDSVKMKSKGAGTEFSNRKQKEDRMKDSNSQILFGEATSILPYLKGSEKRYQNQIKFLKAVIEEKKYKGLRVISLKKSKRSATYEYLIVESGSKEHFRTMFFESVQEIFKRIHPGKEMKEMWADGVLADTPDPGCIITDLRPFKELRHEITQGWYSIEEILQDVAVGEDALHQVNCSRCGVKLMDAVEAERKYGSWTGSEDYLAEQKRALNNLGTVCTLCGKGFCATCMISYGKPHPQGGQACLKCSGKMTLYTS